MLADEAIGRLLLRLRRSAASNPVLPVRRGVTLTAQPTHGLKDCQSFTPAGLLDFPLEEAAALRLVDDLDVGVSDGDGSVRSVGRRAVVVARKVDVGRPADDLNRRVAVFVRQPLPEAVHAARLRLRPGRVLPVGAEAALFPGPVSVPVRGRYDVLVGLNRTHGCRHVPARPVELAVVDVALPVAEVLEQLAQVVVVRRLEEVESSDVAEVGGHFLRLAFAQDLDGGGSLRVPDLLIPAIRRSP